MSVDMFPLFLFKALIFINASRESEQLIMTDDVEQVRAAVRERYARTATNALSPAIQGGCCGGVPRRHKASAVEGVPLLAAYFHE